MKDQPGKMMNLFAGFYDFCLRKYILALLSLFFSLNIFAQDYNIRNFTTNDGLPQGFVYSLCQDASGYLWVGTGNGLSRYNGFVFESYTENDSLADNFITCSYRQQNGVWFGHMNGGLSYYNGSNFQKVNTKHSDLGRLLHFSKSPSGKLWVSSYSGALLCLSADSGVIKYNTFREPAAITTFEFIDETNILAGTNIGLLSCRLDDSGEIITTGRAEGIPQTKIVSLVKGDKNTLYAATENEGVYRIRVTENHIKSSKTGGADITAVQDLYFDTMSNLWICTFGQGLIRVGSKDSTAITYLNTGTGFPTDNVKTVFEDREGNIWSGNYGNGLTQIYSRTFSVLKFENPSYGNSIFSICTDSKFRWIGTESGLAKTDSLKGYVIKYYGKENGLPKDTITMVCSAPDNGIWIGTGRNGVFRLDRATDRITKIPIADGSLENSVTAIVISNGNVYVGTKKGLCSMSSYGQ